MGEHEEMNLAAEAAENVETVSTEEIAGQDEQTEQVEQQSEQPVVKTYTQEEVDRLMGERVARERRKMSRDIEKELEKYKELENVLKAGTGKDSVEDITAEFTKHYQSKGVEISNRKEFNDNDIITLAKSDAAEIISLGLDEVIDEVDRLANKGVQNMTPRERHAFAELCEYRKTQESRNELLKIGVSNEVFESKEFKEYAAMFNSETPITKVYEMYAKETAPQVEKIGSLQNGGGPEEKMFYTPEEVDKLTEKDYQNPVIRERVRKSMFNWK